VQSRRLVLVLAGSNALLSGRLWQRAYPSETLKAGNQREVMRLHFFQVDHSSQSFRRREQLFFSFLPVSLSRNALPPLRYSGGLDDMCMSQI